MAFISWDLCVISQVIDLATRFSDFFTQQHTYIAIKCLSLWIVRGLFVHAIIAVAVSKLAYFLFCSCIWHKNVYHCNWDTILVMFDHELVLSNFDFSISIEQLGSAVCGLFATL